MAITKKGKELWANALGNAAGLTGTTSSAPTATKVVDTVLKGFTAAHLGKDIIIEGKVGTIVKFESSSEVLVLRWEAPGARGGATVGTPNSGTYVITAGNTPGYYMGLSKKTGEPSAGELEENKLPEEILWVEEAKPSPGLVRASTTWSYTEGKKEYKLEKTFTATKDDVLPVTIGRIGIFNGGYVVADKKTSYATGVTNILFHTKLASTATLSNEGDSVAITDTVEGS